MSTRLLVAVTITSLTIFFIVLFNYRPTLSVDHGRLSTKLYLGQGELQPLIVGFGGGEGGNAWASDRWSETRQQFIDSGYAFLAIGYFGSPNTPAALDRISLDAIRDTIRQVCKNPRINSQQIALIGGSKGGELVLNLASRYPDYSAVAALVPAHVSFPALTHWANTSSWMRNDIEVPYVSAPFETIIPALKGDLHGAFSLMLADSAATKNAQIPIEKINAPLLLISATADEQWPSSFMCKQMIKRLKASATDFHFEHIDLPGSHTAPLREFHRVHEFLSIHFPAKQAIHTSVYSPD